jgi:hypothetical protein
VGGGPAAIATPLGVVTASASAGDGAGGSRSFRILSGSARPLYTPNQRGGARRLAVFG